MNLGLAVHWKCAKGTPQTSIQLLFSVIWNAFTALIARTERNAKETVSDNQSQFCRLVCHCPVEALLLW